MDEYDEKDGELIDAEDKMFAPIEWDSTINFKIQDLNESLYEEHHYFREEPMCKSIGLINDKISVDCYLKLIKTWMMDTTSLVALSINSGRVVGVAVTRINGDSDKTNIYERNQILTGEPLQNIMLLINEVMKQSDAYVKFGQDVCLRLYILCVHPTYKNKGVESTLLRAFVQAGRTMKLPAVGGIFTSGYTQLLAEQAGLKILSEIRYNRWIVNDAVVFDDPGKGNYSAAYMGKLIDYNEPTDKYKYDV